MNDLSDSSDEHVDRNRRYWQAVAPWRNRWLDEFEPFRNLADFFESGRTTLVAGEPAADGCRSEADLLGDVAGKRLLHLGTGSGHDSLSWASLGARVCALDFAAANLNHLRQLSGMTRLPVQAVAADVRRLPVRTEQFDLVYAAGLVAWLPDLTALFCEAARVLRPGGMMLLVEEDPTRIVADGADEATTAQQTPADHGTVHTNEMDYADWPMPPGLRLETSEFVWTIPTIVAAIGASRLRADRILRARWRSVWEAAPQISPADQAASLLVIRARRD